MKTIVIAPHPDDELMGVGGTLLRRKEEGASTAWMIVTGISSEHGWHEKKVKQRKVEINRVAEFFGFDSVFQLNFPTALLDTVRLSDIVSAMANAFNEFEPNEVFLPFPYDAHTDHRITFDAAISCTKWFRYPSVKRVLTYETLSETDFGLEIGHCFKPNYFVNIEDYLQKKLQATNIYKSEFGKFPFPRSVEAIKSLSDVRGAASGFKAAEAFQLLREFC
jgi:LmbE family N-acetylglucosaminyl deacetylase